MFEIITIEIVIFKILIPTEILNYNKFKYTTQRIAPAGIVRALFQNLELLNMFSNPIMGFELFELHFMFFFLNKTSHVNFMVRQHLIYSIN